MSNIINADQYIKAGDKVYKVAGGSASGRNIITANSREELPDPSTVAEGTIALVPSEGATRVIDMAKYAFEDGMPFLNAILYLFANGGGKYSAHDDGSFWSDLDTDKSIAFVFDGSALVEGLTITSPALNVTKLPNFVDSVAFSFVLRSDVLMNISVFFQRSYLTGGTYLGTDIYVAIEPLNVPNA